MKYSLLFDFVFKNNDHVKNIKQFRLIYFELFNFLYQNLHYKTSHCNNSKAKSVKLEKNYCS